MKNSPLILVSFFLFFFFSFSSQHLLKAQFCVYEMGTSTGYDPAMNNLSVFDGPYYIRVYFHIVNQQHPESSAESAFQILNNDFNGRNIFFEWDCHVNYIENFAPDITNSLGPEDHVYNINNHDDGIDVYLFNDSHRDGLFGRANGVGQSSEFAIFDPDIFHAPLTHEMGHILNLFHTHHKDPCLEIPSNNCINPSSNGITCGDFVLDTPADPDLGQYELVDAINCIFEEITVIDFENETTMVYKCTDPRNFMSRAPKHCRDKFSDGQIIRAKNSIQTLSFLQDCLLDDQPHIIDTDVTLDNHQAYYNDVIIKNGATLTIQTTVSMREGKEIIVEEGGELIVKGGEISNYCDELWSGIKVFGKHLTEPKVGPNHVEVEFTDDDEGKRSVISNVDDAAVSMIPPTDFPAILNFGNGILKADNTTFNNVDVMVQFIAMRPSVNMSSINDCIQNGGTYGVKNWNCLNIEVSNNKFNDISKYCIENEEGALTIVGNEFHSQEIDVFFNFVNPPLLVSTIQNNDFLGSAIGLVYMGGTLDEEDANEVSNNTFINDEINAQFEGQNRFDFTQNSLKNTIAPQFGFQCANSGSAYQGENVNKIDQNSFEQNVMAMYLQGVNQNVVFRSNCFNSMSSSPGWGAFDIYVKDKVHPIQASGDNDAPANNCFTHQGNSNATVFDVQGNSFELFTYIEPKGDQAADPCKFAILAHPNVNKSPTGDDFDIPCGSNQTVILNPECCNLNPDAPFGMMISNRFQELRSQLIHSSDEKDQILYFQSYIQEGDFDNARGYLASLDNLSIALQDFFLIQSLYIDRYELENYGLSSNQLQEVLTIAQKNHEYSAFAKSLYFRQTGILLLEPFPDLNQNQQQRISKENNDILRAVNISPNPFNTELTIDLNLEKDSKILIFDGTGSLVFSRYIESGQDCLIQTTNWRQGVYFCQIIGNKKVLHQEKLLLIE